MHQLVMRSYPLDAPIDNEVLSSPQEAAESQLPMVLSSPQEDEERKDDIDQRIQT